MMKKKLAVLICYVNPSLTVMEAQMLTQNQSQVTDVIYPVSDHPLSEKAQILLPARLLIDRGAKGNLKCVYQVSSFCDTFMDVMHLKYPYTSDTHFIMIT